MISLEEQQKIVAQKINQPIDVVKEVGLVDEKTGVFYIFVATDETGDLISGKKLKGYRGGYTLLVGKDGGVLSGGSAFSLGQLLARYEKGERNPN